MALGFDVLERPKLSIKIIHPCLYEYFQSFSFTSSPSRVPKELTKSTRKQGNSSDAGGRAGRPGAFPGLRGARCAGTGAGGRRRALAGPRSGPVPPTFAPVFGRYLAATITQCLRSRVPTKTARDEMWPRCPRKRSRKPAARAGSCRWCRSVGVPLVRRDWTCRSDGRARRRCPGLAHGAAGEA